MVATDAYMKLSWSLRNRAWAVNTAFGGGGGVPSGVGRGVGVRY